MIDLAASEAVDRHKIILKVLELLKSISWADLSLLTLACEMEIRPLTLYRHFMTKGDLLTGMIHYIDQKMLERYREGGSETRSIDALFDIVMCRLEGLEPHKNVLRSLGHELWRTPFNTLEACPSALNSFKRMLELAHVSTAGISGMIKLKAFVIVYGIIVKTWLEDTETGLSKTMAVADKLLKKIGPVLEGL